MSMGAATHERLQPAATHEMLQPPAAQERLPTAGTIGADVSVVVDTQVMTQKPLTIFPFNLNSFLALTSTQVVIAVVRACARFPMQVNILERSAVVAMASDGPTIEEEIESVLSQLPPVPMLEGPSAIPKNSAGMDPAPQAVMFPPTHPPHINCNS